MKKLIFLSIMVIALSFVGTAFAEEPIKVVLNGEDLVFDQPPVIRNNRVYVPIRVVSEKLGATVGWDSGSIVTINGAKETLLLRLDDNRYDLNKMPCIGDVAPFAQNGRTLVPVRMVAQSLDCDVEWDGANQTVVITKKANAEDGYASYKSDKNKPLVYDAMRYDNGNFSYAVPKLNINHPNAEELNNRILLDKSSYITYAKQDFELGAAPGCPALVYTYFVCGDILSLVGASINDGGGAAFYTVNYDLKNNVELTSQDIIRLSGNDVTSFTSDVQNKCKNLFGAMYGHYADYGVFSYEFYNEAYNRAGSNDCYSENSSLYVNSNGNITAVIDFPSVAGADSYDNLFDTGVKLDTDSKQVLPIVGKWHWSNPQVPVQQLIDGKVTEYVGDSFRFGSITFNEDGTYNMYDMHCIWYTNENGESFYDGASGAGILKGRYQINGNTITMYNETEAYPQHNDDCSWIVEAKITFMCDANNFVITDVVCNDADFKEELMRNPVLKR